MLAILGLLDTPTGGTYLPNGQQVAQLDHASRARIRNRRSGFIFQSSNLIGDLTVFENVELLLTYRGLGAAERKERAMEALEKVGQSHRLRHYPSQLSGGQQQRVAVARALGGKPSILLADETHRKPGLQEWRCGHGSAASTAPRRRHDLHGDP